MKPVLLALTSLLLSAIAGGTGAAETCLPDTSQADFQTGTIPTSVDTATSSGNVILASSAGGGSIDQQNTTFTVGLGERCSLIPNNNQWCGQTFTAGKSGSLSRIDVNMGCFNCSPLPAMIVSVRATSGGVPTGPDLASATFSMTSTTQIWYSANFVAPATVSSGTKYAIVIHPSHSLTAGAAVLSDSAKDASTGSDVYAGGAVVFSKDSGASWLVETGPAPSVDGAFKTYIGSGAGGYSSAGDLISSTKDSNSGTASTNWSTLSWHNTAPTGTTLKFQAAASDNSTGPFTFVGPDGSTGSFFTASGASLSQFNGNRYLKYRAYLTTSSSTATPTLNDATACYSLATPATSSDVSISVSDGATAEIPGSPVTYTITASNSGPDPVSGAKVSDTFQAPLTSCNWTCAGGAGGTCSSQGIGSINDTAVNLPVGGTATYTATCTLPTSATGTLSNTATITNPTGVTDPSPGNNSSMDSEPLTPQVDLSITINDGQSQTTAGAAAFTYTILAQNPGPSDAPSSTLADNFPSTLTCNWTCAGTNGGTCPSSGSGDINATVGLPKGGRTTFTATCSLASSATGNLVNTATVSPADGVTDTGGTNNSVTDSDSIVVQPNVAITLTDNAEFVQVGEVIDYVITVTDAGPSDAAVNVTDSLPAQLGDASWVCAATGGASCAGSKNSGSSTSMNTNATVPVGGVLTYTFTATVQSDDASNSFYNIAYAHVTNGSDPNGANNSATDTDKIVIFVNDFSGSSTLQRLPNGGAGSMTVDLGVDAGLLATLGPAPVTVATARSTSGHKLFSLQLMRAGGDVLMRSLTSIDGSAFSDVAAWQVVDLAQHRIAFEWGAATTRGDDGFLRAGSATRQTLMAANNSREMPAQLQIATVDNIPWLVLIQQ